MAAAPPPPKSEFLSKNIVAGGTAGMLAKTITAPLERLKMLAQTSALSTSAGAETTGIFNITRQVVKTEGISGFWAGNGTNLVRIFPAKAIVFSCNDFYKVSCRRP